MAPASEAEPLLEVRDLGVRRDRESLLQGVALTVRRGSIHALIGPNGAGKSTLLAAVLGLTAFEGRVVAHWRRGGRIGFVPQTFGVDRTLPISVADFLGLSRQRLPVCAGLRPATRRRVAGLLARVGLAGFERRPLAALSGGELRRVLLANAIDPLPELLVLDEPATGLDELSAARFESLLLELRSGEEVTVLMVSHDLRQVLRVADRVTVLDRTVRRDCRAEELAVSLPVLPPGLPVDLLPGLDGLAGTSPGPAPAAPPADVGQARSLP